MSDRERQLLEERDRILDRLVQLDGERRELQNRLTLIDLELGDLMSSNRRSAMGQTSHCSAARRIVCRNERPEC